MPTLTWTQQLQRGWLKGRHWFTASGYPGDDSGLSLWKEAMAQEDVAAVQRLVDLQILPAQGPSALALLAWELLSNEPEQLAGVSVARMPTQADGGWENNRQGRIRRRRLVGSLLAAGLDPLAPHPLAPTKSPSPTLMEMAFQKGHLAWYRALKEHHPALLNQVGPQGCPLYMQLLMRPSLLTEEEAQHLGSCWDQLFRDMQAGLIQPQLMGKQGQNLVSLALNHRASTLRRLMDHWPPHPMAVQEGIPPEHRFQPERVNVVEWLGNPHCLMRVQNRKQGDHTIQVPVKNEAERAQEIRGMLDQLWHNGYQTHLWDADTQPRRHGFTHARNALGQTAFHAWLKTGLPEPAIWAFFEEKERSYLAVVSWWSRDTEGNTALEALLTNERLWRTQPALGEALWHHVESEVTPRGLAKGRINAQGDTAEQAMQDQIDAWDTIGSKAAVHLAPVHARLVAAHRQADALRMEVGDQPIPSDLAGLPAPPRRRLRS